MPYFSSNQEWYEQSSLLLKARPTTTRITSKYTVRKPSASKIRKRKNYLEKRAAAQSANPPAATEPIADAAPSQNPEEPVSTFTLKTYDPVSGTCLQYETNKAAEVGRLIGALGRLGRHMAALPETTEDLSAPADGAGLSTPKVEEDVHMGGTEAKPAVGGGGGKKKKKGKK